MKRFLSSVLVFGVAWGSFECAARADDEGTEASHEESHPGEPPPPSEPFAFGDFSWMPGNGGSSEHPLKAGPFTGELRVDTAYHYSFAHPKDNTISGSSEVFRHNELQLTQLGIGGDFLWKGVQARLMTQFGMYSQTTPRNDASPSRGQWGLDNAYRYISEAYGGYHFDVMHGINVQAGIFMSYIGLWSYYNADNWTYQPSYVSSNTPWFFTGARAQFFIGNTLKMADNVEMLDRMANYTGLSVQQLQVFRREIERGRRLPLTWMDAGHEEGPPRARHGHHVRPDHPIGLGKLGGGQLQGGERPSPGGSGSRADFRHEAQEGPADIRLDPGNAHGSGRNGG